MSKRKSTNIYHIKVEEPFCNEMWWRY